MGQSICTGSRDEENNNIDVKAIFNKKDVYVKQTRKSPLLRRQIRQYEIKLERAKTNYKQFKDDQALNRAALEGVFANSCTSERAPWGRKAKALYRR